MQNKAENHPHNPEVSIIVSLYNCEPFLDSFFTYSEKIVNRERYEFLLLHNAPTSGEIDIINRNIEKKTYYKHIIIQERELLYQTWNRGVRLAKAPYLTVWNVDDIRFPESVEWQKKALDDHPEAALVYGDIWISNQYGVQGTWLGLSPRWTEKNKTEFCLSYYMSCFQMWRKSIHEKIGFYDEQFWCSADFDFQIRVALHYPLVKVPEPLGIYLDGENQTHKISSNGKQQKETHTIYLRYGVFKKLDITVLWNRKFRYQKDKLLFYGQWVDFTEKSPFSLLQRVTGMLIALFKFPLYLLHRVRKMLHSR